MGGATTGLFTGTLINARFEEWDFNLDLAVPDGGCVVINSATINQVY